MNGMKVQGRLVSLTCELFYSQSWCFGISAVQSCRKYRHYFYCIYNSLAIIYVRVSGVPSISVSPSKCLFGQFQLDLGFRMKMLLWRRLRVEAKIHYPLCFGRVRWWYIFLYGLLVTWIVLLQIADKTKSSLVSEGPLVQDSPGQCVVSLRKSSYLFCLELVQPSISGNVPIWLKERLPSAQTKKTFWHCSLLVQPMKTENRPNITEHLLTWT